MLLIQGALLVSAIFTIPMIVYQLWLFIAPGLLRKERRIVGPVHSKLVHLVSCWRHVCLLCLKIGASDSHWIQRSDSGPRTKHSGLQVYWIHPDNDDSFRRVFRISIGAGSSFAVGIIDARYLAERRRWAILIMAVVAAAATPTPDPINMCVMRASPLIVLYEGSIINTQSSTQCRPRANRRRR